MAKDRKSGPPMGHGQGSKHEGQDGEIGQHADATPGRAEPEVREGAPGRSGSSPGHLKKAAGVQSARDFATGHAGVTREKPGRGNEKARVEKEERVAADRAR